MSKSKDTLLLDDADRRLLAVLRKDARTPIARLAKSLGIARASVYARLRKLQQSGVIEGFTVRLSPELERRQIRAIVKRFGVSREIAEMVVAARPKKP